MPDDEKEDWYNNKELFEMIQGLRDDLKETRNAVQKYNNIRKKLNNVMERLTAIEEQKTGRYQVGQAIREWGGWIATTILIILRIAGVI